MQMHINESECSYGYLAAIIISRCYYDKNTSPWDALYLRDNATLRLFYFSSMQG